MPHSPLSPLSRCCFYLVRHGETEWNVAGRIQGQLDSKLTENGIKETRVLAEKLRDIIFDGIYSSDLTRAAETAEILRLERKLAVVHHKALRERTFGIYDGYYGDAYTKEVEHLLQQYHLLPEEERWRFKFAEGYESDFELVDRFTAALREISSQFLGKTVLVVTHGGNLRSFLTHLGFAPHGELSPGTFKNSGYIKVHSDGTEFFLEEVEGVDKSQGIALRTL